MKKVVLCTPTVTRPYEAFLAAVDASVPAVVAAGWDCNSVYEIGNPYISGARAAMTRKALDAKAAVLVYLDHDLSWRPEDLVRLLETPGDCVAGTYRFKKDEEEYMGGWACHANAEPVVASDGTFTATAVPAGFLKITAEGLERFARAYPELLYGARLSPHIDLFNHGARDWVWYGEDMGFSRRWIERVGEIRLVPDLDLVHHTPERAFPGNLHRFMLRQPGGSECAS